MDFHFRCRSIFSAVFADGIYNWSAHIFCWVVCWTVFRVGTDKGVPPLGAIFPWYVFVFFFLATIYFIYVVPTGLGFCTLVVITFVTIYYMVVISWILFYFFASFFPKLLWGYCDNSFNSNSKYPCVLWLWL